MSRTRIACPVSRKKSMPRLLTGKWGCSSVQPDAAGENRPGVLCVRYTKFELSRDRVAVHPRSTDVSRATTDVAGPALSRHLLLFGQTCRLAAATRRSAKIAGDELSNTKAQEILFAQDDRVLKSRSTAHCAHAVGVEAEQPAEDTSLHSPRECESSSPWDASRQSIASFRRV